MEYSKSDLSDVDIFGTSIMLLLLLDRRALKMKHFLSSLRMSNSPKNSRRDGPSVLRREPPASESHLSLVCLSED